MTDHTFYRYIRLHEMETVWASGFMLRPLGHVHGNWSALGEFVCWRSAAKTLERLG